MPYRKDGYNPIDLEALGRKAQQELEAGQRLLERQERGEPIGDEEIAYHMSLPGAVKMANDMADRDDHRIIQFPRERATHFAESEKKPMSPRDWFLLVLALIIILGLIATLMSVFISFS